ncbi:MAG: PAS domain S-box protein, partial [Bacteroidales bacterium]|nr:PAS domain S-box protein [Bacteroidales bacterium]
SERDTVVEVIMIFRIDPREVLYPVVQTWPFPVQTAEAFIVRKEDDKVVYLNELRFRRNSALQLREPVSGERIPAAMAVRGIESTTDAVDYRGKKVVAAMKKIPGINWYLVAKVDHNEILSELNEQITLVIIIIVLFILTVGLLLGYIEWNESARFYREKYEKELDRLALRKHFDYILKYANDIIFLIDSNMAIIEANDRAAEIYQYEREELIGLPLSKITADESMRNIAEQKKILDEKGSATYEAYHKRRDGTVFPVEVSSRKVEIEGVRYYQSICRDITERKQAEETLIESEERFRKIFEESPFPMAMTGKDLLILRANESFCKMTGYSEEELKTFTFRNFTHPDYVSRDEVSLMKLVARELPIYHTENKYIRKDNTVIWGSTTVSIIRNNLDEAQYFLFMIEDITLRKKAESELIAAKEKAEESDRLKTAFLHNVSHEIRTPMNAIIGFSALLGEPDTSPEERQQYIDIIFQSGGQLLSIINDIVDIANIESGQVKINKSRINLNAILKSLDEQFSYQEKEGVLSINLVSSLSDSEAVLVTDSTKLIQILSNLISNSIKFTRQGTIDFGYVKKEGFFEFFVRDTGIGIPPEHHEKIFDRFYQVDKASSVKSSGTGLGLSICKAYVELLGGKIWLKSEPGKGSEFRFSIPSGTEIKTPAK